MKRAIPLGVLAILLAGPAMAKDTQFWNLTSSTVKSLELAPAGTSAFGPNQTTNDPDGAVDHDERLKIKGVATGVYDARLKLADGRQCMAKGRADRGGQGVRHRGKGARRLLEVDVLADARGEGSRRRERPWRARRFPKAPGQTPCRSSRATKFRRRREISLAIRIVSGQSSRWNISRPRPSAILIRQCRVAGA